MAVAQLPRAVEQYIAGMNAHDWSAVRASFADRFERIGPFPEHHFTKAADTSSVSDGFPPRTHAARPALTAMDLITPNTELSTKCSRKAHIPAPRCAREPAIWGTLRVVLPRPVGERVGIRTGLRRGERQARVIEHFAATQCRRSGVSGRPTAPQLRLRCRPRGRGPSRSTTLR